MPVGRFELTPVEAFAVKALDMHKRPEFTAFRSMIQREIDKAMDLAIGPGADRDWHAGYVSALRRLQETVSIALATKG